MKRVPQAPFPVVAITHPGMRGKNNEDSFAVVAFQLSARNATPVLLAVLSDGIGGHRAGEVASEMVVNRVSQVIADSSGAQPTAVIRRAVELASRDILANAQDDVSRHGMGATLAVVWIIGKHLYTTTVGDSRIYLLRGGVIRQVSTDHTWIQEALSMGIIQLGQVQGHPNLHVIRRYLGSQEAPEPDFRIRLVDDEENAHAVANQGMTLLRGDRILLCSDGLSDLVEEEEIHIALQEQPGQAGVQALIDLANSRGGHDNITIIEMEFQPQTLAFKLAALWQSQRTDFLRRINSRKRWLAVGCGGLLVLALSAGGAVLAWKDHYLKPSVTPPVLLMPTSQPSPTFTLAPSATHVKTATTLSQATSALLLPQPASTYTPWPTLNMTASP
jgi:serine/threonine protein phosphatase PrpC